MSILLNGGADVVSRPTGLPAASTAMTVALWFKRTGATGAAPRFIVDFLNLVGSDSAVATPDGSSYVAYSQAGVNESSSSLSLVLNTWSYVALRGNGTTLTASKIEVGSNTVISVTTTQVSFVPTNFLIGLNIPGIYAKPRIWNSVLTDAELITEMNSLTLVKTSSVMSSHNTLGNLASSLADNSGNGHTLLSSGSATTSTDEPPIGSGGSGSGTNTVTGGGLSPVVTVQSVVGSSVTSSVLTNVSTAVNFIVTGSDGSPFEGLTVNFNVTANGSLAASFGTTDVNGVVTAVFSSGVTGNYTVTATCAGVSGTSTITVTTSVIVISGNFIVPASPRLGLNSTEYRRLTGPGLLPSFTSLTGFAGLGMSQPGLESRISFRVRVPSGKGGTIKSIRYYSPGGSGYASGNGGIIRISILADDGTPSHLPQFNGTLFARGDYSPSAAGMVNGIYPTTIGQFPLVELNGVPKIAVSENNLIHIHFEETTKSTVNWASVNVTTSTASIGYADRWLDPTDGGVILYQGGSNFSGAGTSYETSLIPFEPAKPDGGYYCSPIFEIEMDNGNIWGTADMETSAYVGAHWIRSVGQKICERFTPLVTETYTALSVRTAANVANSSAILRIIPTSGGTAIMTSTINQSAANYSFVPTFGPGFDADRLTWYDRAPTTLFSLTAGVSYDIEFEPTAGSWVLGTHLNGASYGFRHPATWTQSNAKEWNGSSYVDAYKPGSPRNDANWDFVLHRQPQGVVVSAESDDFFMFF